MPDVRAAPQGVPLPVTWQIITADARVALDELPEQSVHACITSPPYYGLRDYGHDDQIGLEDSPGEYIEHLVEVFAHVHRVLRDDGTLWLNLGDSYASKSRGSDRGWEASRLSNPGTIQKMQAASLRRNGERHRGKHAGFKEKDLMGIPWLTAFALREWGWYLRQEVIWNKTAPMPESIRDRTTRSHEQIFMFSKRPQYFYDAEALREPDIAGHPQGNNYKRPERLSYTDASGEVRGSEVGWEPGGGRNRRSVWTYNPEPYPDAHFAVMPTALATDMVLAATPPAACAACARPYEQTIDRERLLDGETPVEGAWATRDAPRRMPANGVGHGRISTVTRVDDWKPACSCNAGEAPAVVLDPFAGAGTTGIAAVTEKRHFVGVELVAEYADMARDRIATYIRLGHRNPVRPKVPDDHPALFE